MATNIYIYIYMGKKTHRPSGLLHYKKKKEKKIHTTIKEQIYQETVGNLMFDATRETEHLPVR